MARVALWRGSQTSQSQRAHVGILTYDPVAPGNYYCTVPPYLLFTHPPFRPNLWRWRCQKSDHTDDCISTITRRTAVYMISFAVVPQFTYTNWWIFRNFVLKSHATNAPDIYESSIELRVRICDIISRDGGSRDVRAESPPGSDD